MILIKSIGGFLLIVLFLRTKCIFENENVEDGQNGPNIPNLNQTNQIITNQKTYKYIGGTITGLALGPSLIADLETSEKNDADQNILIQWSGKCKQYVLYSICGVYLLFLIYLISATMVNVDSVCSFDVTRSCF